MATFTASEYNPLKANHIGVNVVRSRFTGSLTVSEVLLLARIPNHAVVMDWRISGGQVASASTGTWKIGVQGTVVDHISGSTLTDDSLHAGVSLTASGAGGALDRANTSNKCPFKVSLSDDAATQFIWIAGLYTAGSFTGTHSINFVVEYVMGEGNN
jgi:hypothetical protein